MFLWNDEARLYIISTFTNVIILSIPQARLILYISNPLHLHYMPKDVIRFQKHKEYVGRPMLMLYICMILIKSHSILRIDWLVVSVSLISLMQFAVSRD